MSAPNAFDFFAFDIGAFDTDNSTTTSTFIMRLPVNCVLLQDQLEPWERDDDIKPMNIHGKVRATFGGQMSEGKTGFTVKVSNRGYD